jgi:hypothetical protein
MKIQRPKNNRGFMLLMMVFLIFFISVATAGFLAVASTDFQILQNHKFSDRALYISEAGVEDAINRIRQDSSWRRTTGNPLVVEFPVGSGNQYSVVCPESAGSLTKTITSTATLSNGYKRALEVKIRIFGVSARYTVLINYWKEV